MKCKKRFYGVKEQTQVHCLFLIVLAVLFTVSCSSQSEGKVIDLTLDSAIKLSLENSYDIQELRLDIEKSRQKYKAERAGLKSKVELEAQFPEIKTISEYEWDSDLGREILVPKNTRLWGMNFSIRQPLILFGHPTNGYLSLNNRTHRYLQYGGSKETEYYNKTFLKYEQPLFQANILKNNIENAELNLRNIELNYVEDIVELIDDVTDAYYELFEDSCECVCASNHVKNLEKAEEIAKEIAKTDASRKFELPQVQVELANAKESLAESKSDSESRLAEMKQHLNLSEQDSLVVKPTIKITPIDVDTEKAINFAYNLSPSLRKIEIDKRKAEIDLINTKAENSLKIDLEVTCGLENSSPDYHNLWKDYDRAYTGLLNVYIPIWDWGQHKAEVAAERIDLKKVNLRKEERKKKIRLEVINDVKRLNDYQKRAMNMRENLKMARETTKVTLRQYRTGEISIQNLLRSFDSEKNSEERFFHAYCGYRKSLRSLVTDTYWDYEHNKPLLSEFGIKMGQGMPGE